ncbi:hypothetical protein HAX54_041135 [Datura stramonium]|uniref:Uncharacterized protein n=1 Tax=Datura stramonium TaxID=4076 RepID=A0ABS8VRZ2_DATST|nr:hypothetical protein [Datura stramonium]
MSACFNSNVHYVTDVRYSFTPSLGASHELWLRGRIRNAVLKSETLDQLVVQNSVALVTSVNSASRNICSGASNTEADPVIDGCALYPLVDITVTISLISNGLKSVQSPCLKRENAKALAHLYSDFLFVITEPDTRDHHTTDNFYHSKTTLLL